MTIKQESKKEHSRRRRYWALGIAFGCIALSYFLLFLEGLDSVEELPCNVPYFEAEDKTLNYPELLARHEDNPTTESSIPVSFWWLIAALQVITVGLIIFSGVYCFFVLYAVSILASIGICFVCAFGIAASSLDCGGSFLYHQQTVELGNRVYHLTTEMSYANDPFWEDWSVYLFECDSTGEQCHVLHSETDYNLDDPKASLVVDAESDKIQMYVDDRLVYTVLDSPNRD